MPIEIGPKQLHKQLRLWRELYRPHMDQRKKALDELVGSCYGGVTGDLRNKKRPVNLLAFTVQTLIPLLAHKNPEHEVTPAHSILQGESAALKLQLDQLAEEVRYVKTSRINLLEAIISPFSMTKVGIRAGGDTVKVRGRQYDMGKPYVQHILPGDYFRDPFACSLDEVMWEGHKYRVPKQIAIESGLFNPKLIERVPTIRQSGDTFDEMRMRLENPDIGDDDRTELIDMIELVDVAFYDEDITILATLAAADGHDTDFLRIDQYQGPEMGPYECLEFFPLPGTTIGLAPAAMLMEQHDAIVEVSQKLVKQIRRARSILAGNRAAEEDLKTAAASDDGEIAEFDDAASVREFKLGGAIPEIVEGFGILRQIGEQAAGTPSMLAGASADTESATEYEGRMGQASSRVQDMGALMHDFNQRISKHLAFYLTTDPLIRKGGTMRIPGGEWLTVTYDAATRKGSFPDFTYKIIQRSTGMLDPSVQSRRLMEGLNVILSAAQVAAVTGGLVDLGAVSRVVSRTPGSEGLEEVIRDPILQQVVAARMGAQPANTPGQVTGQVPQSGGSNFSMGQSQGNTRVDASRGARSFAGSGGPR